MVHLKPIHPFPARMAPEIALDILETFRPRIVLDPMVGSGTVLRIASNSGCRSLGFDLDPLAVLIARVWCTPIDPAALVAAADAVVSKAKRISADRVRLPWIDRDDETAAFVEYWFGEAQRRALRRLSRALMGVEPSSVRDALWVALSRTIITKDNGASLARDVSHSRPHKVKTSSSYDVFAGFLKAAASIARIFQDEPPSGNVLVQFGDARTLPSVENNSVDLVMTSPPYLNAIDYLRGHRLSLVWMGYRLGELRAIRAQSVGAERGLAFELPPHLFPHLRAAGDLTLLPPRFQAIVARYVFDLDKVIGTAARVLKPGGYLVLVMGDTYLYGVFVRNSAIAWSIAESYGLRLEQCRTRELVARRRYLPPPDGSRPGIHRRIGQETILTFRKSP